MIHGNDSTIFEDLKEGIKDELEDEGVTLENLRIFWEEDEDDWTRIKNNNGLLMAIDEMGSPPFKIFVCKANDETNGKKSILN